MSSDGVRVVTGEGEVAQGLVPTSRFPEFRDAGEWRLGMLGDLLSEPKEKNRSLAYGPEHVLSVSGEHGCVNQIELLGRSYAGASVKDYNVVKTGDIVYTKSPLKACPNGIIKANNGPSGIVSVLYAVYRPTESADPRFIDFYFSSDIKLNTYLQPIVKKGPKNSILVNNTDVLQGAFAAPTHLEQRKIADCLSSLDAVIAAEGERLAALRDHKRGLMQALFPAPGQTTPRLRFPEFRDAGEWEEKPLGKICEVAQGFGFPDRMQGKSVGEYPFCKVSDISRAVNENGGLLETATNYVDHADLKVLGARTIPTGATVFAKIGEALRLNRRAIAGVVCLIDNNAVALKAKDGVTVPYFLFSLSQTIDMNDYCGGAVPSVNKSTLEAIVVQAPGLAEQTKVAGYFQSIDSVIASQLEQIHSLKAHKSGLMQQLFPPPAELSA